jgi:hypothetical protein
MLPAQVRAHGAEHRSSFIFLMKENRTISLASEKNCFNYYSPLKKRGMLLVYNLFCFQKENEEWLSLYEVI